MVIRIDVELTYQYVQKPCTCHIAGDVVRTPWGYSLCQYLLRVVGCEMKMFRRGQCDGYEMVAPVVLEG